jgi:hypothetical protein
MRAFQGPKMEFIGLNLTEDERQTRNGLARLREGSGSAQGVEARRGERKVSGRVSGD